MESRTRSREPLGCAPSPNPDLLNENPTTTAMEIMWLFDNLGVTISALQALPGGFLASKDLVKVYLGLTEKHNHRGMRQPAIILTTPRDFILGEC